MPIGRQAGQQGMDTGIDSRAQLSPMSCGNRRTAIPILAASCLDFTGGGAMIVHRLPHTACVGKWSRDRQGRGDVYSRKQQHKQ
jgi:hypothetical protein